MAISNKKTTLVLKTMSKKDLEAATKIICKASSKQQVEIAKIAQAEAWKIKGYNSFKEYCVNDLPEVSYDTLNLYRRVGVVLCTVEDIDAVGKYSCDSIKPMFKLEVKQQKKLWNKLLKQCKEDKIPPKWLTRVRVEQALMELGFLESKGNDCFDGESTEKCSAESHKDSDLTQSNSEKKFMKNMEDESLAGKGFPRRVAESLNKSFSDKNLLNTCLLISKSFGNAKLISILEEMRNKY